MRAVKPWIAPLAVFAGACGDGAAMRLPPQVSIRFEHRAPTENLPGIDEACASLVMRTHIHPSWRGYRVVPMHAGEDGWVLTLNDVPPGAHKIRVSDPNACFDNATGAVISMTVFANGVLLTRRVDTPGDGVEPGFGFSALPDGSVTP